MNLARRVIEGLRGLLHGGRPHLSEEEEVPQPARPEPQSDGDRRLPARAPDRNFSATPPAAPAAKFLAQIAPTLSATPTERRPPAAEHSDAGACDFCAGKWPAGGILVKAESLRSAVVNGFRITQIEWGPISVVNAAMRTGAFRELGTVHEARVYAGWMRRVASDDTDWAACPRCGAVIEAALAGKPTGQIAHLGKMYSGYPLDALQLMYMFPPSDKAARGTSAHLEHVIKESTGADLKDVGARLGPNLKLADNDRLGQAIADADGGADELKKAQAQIQAEYPETVGAAYEFHWRMYALGVNGPYGALLFVYGPPLNPREPPSDEQGLQGHDAASAWYFLVVPGRPDNLEDYCTRLLKDFPHPAVNANVIVDANGLSTSVHPVGYALDAVRQYLAPMQQAFRIASAQGAPVFVDFPDLESGKWTVEHVELLDDRGQRIMLVRAFDPKRIERSALPANYLWQTV